MALSPAELRFRPFEPFPFSKPSADEVSDGIIREADAHAALQTRLAVDGVESITPDAAETMLAEYGLERDTRRAVLVEVWQHAFKKLLFRDDQVDTGEPSHSRVTYNVTSAVPLSGERSSRIGIMDDS